MEELKIEEIIDKYIIVVDGDEKKVVYDIDDSRIFSVHITGCGRGARNAVLNSGTFKDSIEEAKKGIEYLDSCHFVSNFKVIKVSELKDYSEIGYQYLIEDIESYNNHIEWETKVNSIIKSKNEEYYSKLKRDASELVSNNTVESIENDEDFIIIKLNK